MADFACRSWEPCTFCGRTAEFLCDRRDEWGRTCDETMCDEHRFPRRAGGDYCPLCAGRTVMKRGEVEEILIGGDSFLDAFSIVRGSRG